MAALRLFNRPASHGVTLRARAKAFATTTAKILHLPARSRADAPVSPQIGDGDRPPPHPDADLLALRVRFDEALAVWREAEAEAKAARARNDSGLAAFEERETAAADVLMGVSDAIDAMPAVTLAGHAVKARVVREWHYSYLWQGVDEEEGNEWRRQLRAATDALLSLAEG